MSNRVETGPVQFNDDWPGVFIRGDNAHAYANAVGYAAALLKDGDIQKSILQGLGVLLRSSHIENAKTDPDLQRLERKPMT